MEGIAIQDIVRDTIKEYLEQTAREKDKTDRRVAEYTERCRQDALIIRLRVDADRWRGLVDSIDKIRRGGA